MTAFNDHRLMQTPANAALRAVEFVRISRTEDGKGYMVTRCRPYRGDANTHETLATVCGGNLGKALAMIAAQTAANIGLIGTIYLDEDV